MADMSETEIKQAVRKRYAELAVLNRACCGPASEGENAPEESIASSASCGTPVTHASLVEGEVVLDLGSGGGIDVFRSSKLVGPTGKVIGIDSTPEMIFKARQVAEKYGYENVEFRLGEIEHMPLESSSVDVVISNCVLNLVPDKTLAFKEIYRVLKPGGRIAISDMIATAKHEGPINPETWAECITGAVTMGEYENLLRNTGFRDIKHLEENSSLDETCCSLGLNVKSVAWLAAKP
jgi:ubiquinone/menaquinone biosynthesis C-methylase UbiE